jgi:hypothetical protein
MAPSIRMRSYESQSKLMEEGFKKRDSESFLGTEGEKDLLFPLE